MKRSRIKKLKNKVQKNIKLTVFLVIFLVLAAAILGYGYFSKATNLLTTKYYSCIYSEPNDFARCDVIQNPSCKGYYPLKGKDIKDGIDPSSAGLNATCEGFAPQDEYIFDKSGKYLGKQKSPVVKESDSSGLKEQEDAPDPPGMISEEDDPLTPENSQPR